MKAKRAHLAAQIQAHEPALEARVCIEENLPFPTPKAHTLRHLGFGLSAAVPRAPGRQFRSMEAAASRTRTLTWTRKWI